MKKHNNPKINYDQESEVLSFDLGKGKSVDSEVEGNVVLDYDKNGKLVRVNIYGFSFSDFNNDKKALSEFARTAKFPMVST